MRRTIQRLACVGSAALVFVLGCSSPPRPRPPVTPQPAVTVAVCSAIWQEELRRPIDSSGLAGCLRDGQAGKTPAQIRAVVRASPEWAIVHAPAPAVTARRGIVRADRAGLRDDDGPHLFLGATLFWALWGYDHDRARVEQHLEWFQRQGVDYIRVLVSVGGAFWADRSPTPTAANLDGLSALAYSKGLRVQWTIFGGIDTAPTKADRLRLTDLVAASVVAHPEQVFAVEVGNELYGNDIAPTEARDLARRLMTRVPVLVAVTAPRNDTCSEQAVWYSGNVGTLVTLHHDRNQSKEGGLWRPVRQPWREAKFRCPGIATAYASNEPIGPVSSVRSETDPLRLTMNAAVSWLASEGAFVFHTGAGIKGSAYASKTGFRHANVWEAPNVDAALAGIRNVRALLPNTLPNYVKGSSKPAMFDVSSFTSVMRVYCSESGGTFVCLPVNIAAPFTLTARRALTATVYHPLTGSILDTQTLPSGGRLTITANPPAVVIRGSYQ